MKVLLLSVALLFFTGAQGRYFWQKDEPAQEQTIEKVFEDMASIVAKVFENLDLEEIAKEYHLKEKLEAAKKHSEKLEKAVERYGEEVWKRFDEQLNEKFPVFRQKVVPILKELDDKLEEHLKKIVKEAVPVGSDLISGVSKTVIHFFESFETIAEKGRDNVRAEIDSLRAKLQPYADELHAEYQTYLKNSQDQLEKEVKELKEDVEKNVEKVKEHAKPVIDNIKNKLPDGKELQEHVDKLLKNIKEYIDTLY